MTDIKWEIGGKIYQKYNDIWEFLFRPEAKNIISNDASRALNDSYGIFESLIFGRSYSAGYIEGFQRGFREGGLAMEREMNEEWKESQFILFKFVKKTGKTTPTYEEMIGLDREEFKAWLFARTQISLKELLGEMVNYEKETNTHKENDSQDVKKTIQLFREQSIEEILSNNQNAEIQNMIRSKGLSDYYKQLLGEKKNS